MARNGYSEKIQYTIDKEYIRMYEGLSWETEKIRNWSYEFDGNDILKIDKHRTPEEYEEEIKYVDYMVESELITPLQASIAKFDAKYDVLESYVLTRVK